jgi:hypothetical protein
LVSAGQARPAKRSLADLSDPPRHRRGQPALSSVLRDMRDDERY